MTDLPGLLKAREIAIDITTESGNTANIIDALDAAIAAERQSGEGREREADLWKAIRDRDERINRLIKDVAALRARPSGTFAEGVEAAAKIACEEKESLQIARREAINKGDDSSNELWAMQTAAHIEKAIRALTPPSPPEVRGDEMSAAATDVLAERARHISVEGWTPEHDDTHDKGEMVLAGATYAAWAAAKSALWRMATYTDPVASAGMATVVDLLWPWDRRWWKPKDRRRDLVRAGALIIAEIERLDRADAAARDCARGEK